MLPSVGDLSSPLMAIFYINSDSIIAKTEKEKNSVNKFKPKPNYTKSIAYTRQMKMYYNPHLATHHSSLKTYTDSKKFLYIKYFLL